MMQINQIQRFDLNQSFLLRSVVIVQYGLTGIIWVIVLTGKDRPPKHTTDQGNKNQRQGQQKIENFHC